MCVNALMIELKKRGLNVRDELPIQIYYDSQLIGEYFADLVVNELLSFD